MSNFLEPYAAARARLIQARREADKLVNHPAERESLGQLIDTKSTQLEQLVRSLCDDAVSLSQEVEDTVARLRAQQKGEQA